MGRARAEPEVEIGACRPVQLVGFEMDGDRVVVLRPRFIKGPLARWLLPRLKNRHFKVHLDEIGTFVWNHCDGETTVAQILAGMEQHFGSDQTQLEKRLQMFLFELERGAMIEMRLPDGD